MEGYIKFYRSVLENPIVCKDTEHFAIWSYILLNATHQEMQAYFKGEKITLMPGQLIVGRQAISEHFGGKSSLSESKVQRVLKTLEIEQQIEQQTSNKNRLITVVNWKNYQSSEQQIETPLNNQRTTTEQPVNTNKNVKNVIMKEELKENVISNTKENVSRFVKPSIKDVSDYCKERGNSIDGEAFWNFYESKGWKIGQTPMKSWKAAVVTWEKKDNGITNKKPRDPKQAIGEEIGTVY